MDFSDEDIDWAQSTDTLCTAGNTEASPPRIVAHFDLDCFYAQVEMIRNPALRDQPLGIQQKYIIVTCNYVARQHGVTKLMSVKDAKEKCSQLVLVKGEDLTHYREMSYRVTELLKSFSPLVERLGFDENFMDITEMVESRMKQITGDASFSFKGHIYNHESSDVHAEDYPRLAFGSHIAAEMREAIHSRLGLTGSAGVASSKLLAKLVSGTFKPNQQTTLLPESTAHLMNSLSGLRQVPGIGHRMAQRLRTIGLQSVGDLQIFPEKVLVKEFGEANAKRIQNLARGIDDSPVLPTGLPQSISDEDSFKKMSSMAEVFQKIEELLASLIDRMYKDGRQPMTFRLTIRRFSTTNRWFSRESRQCPIPNHIGQKILSGCSDGLTFLVDIAVRLFHKMVDTREPFHLTLINVCFSNLQAKCASKGSIASFFSQKSPGKSQSAPQQKQESLTTNGSSACSTLKKTGPAFEADESQGSHHLQQCSQSASSIETPSWLVRPMIAVPQKDEFPGHSKAEQMDTSEFHWTNSKMSRSPSTCLPPDLDPEVFKLLPEHIQMELISNFQTKGFGARFSNTTGSNPVDLAKSPQNIPETPEHQHRSIPGWSTDGNATFTDYDSSKSNEEVANQHTKAGLRLHDRGPSHHDPPNPDTCNTHFPPNVDPHVFTELPAELQRELLSEWKQQQPDFKMPSKQSGKVANNKKSASKSPQTNNLLKYFKPR